MPLFRNTTVPSKISRSLLLGTVALIVSAQSPDQRADRGREVEDPFNTLNTAVLRDGRAVDFSSAEIPSNAISQDAPDATIALGAGKPDAGLREQFRDKIHPLLRRQMAAREAGRQEQVVVTFRDSLRLPRFPEPQIGEPKDSPSNRASLERAEEIVRSIEAQRSQTFDRLTAEFRDLYRAEVLQRFWITNSVLARMPLSVVETLAQSENVLYIEPQQTQDEPPQDSNNNNDVDDGRARINSDPYFNIGLTGGFIGLLDTGVRASHTLFNNPSHLVFREDCTSGTCGALPNPADDCWNHGTSTAAIISGNGNQGNAFRGITGITLDSFKVYPAGCGGLSTTATLAAFQRAIALLDRIIVAEMQGSGSDQSAISIAADNAFDAGAVIIAANGNNGPAAGSVNAPANAHKVIGVGNYDVQTLNQITSQSRGPTPDNRFKPDIQTPTNTETASNSSDTALRVFGGTSGATPYAAGAAALVRNFLRGTSFSIDPGQVYAFLILSGQQSYPFDNTTGGGRQVLPVNGRAWWGKLSVNGGATIEVPLNISGGSSNTLDVAIWWPETATQAHNDIDLRLIDPSGTVQDISLSIPSVFERTRVPGTVRPGTWKLRLHGFSVPAGPQTVYWAAHVRQ
jgi:hypothetical protein